MRLSLKLVMPLTFLLFIFLLYAWGMYYGYYLTDRHVEQSTRNEIKHDLTRLQETLEYALRKGDRLWVQEEVAAFGAYSHFKIMLLFDEQMEIVASLDRSLIGKSFKEWALTLQQNVRVQFLKIFTTARETLTGQILLDKSKKNLYGIFPVRMGSAPGEIIAQKIGLILTIADLNERKIIEHKNTQRLILNFAVILGLFTFSLWIFFHFRLTRRVLQLVASTQSIKKGAASIQTGIRGRDEIAELARALEETWHHRAAIQKALTKSEEQYRLFIENCIEMVSVVDTQGRYIYVNPQQEKLLGYSQQEFLNIQAKDLLHPDDFTASVEKFALLLNSLRTSVDQWRFKHKSGEWRWYECSSKVYTTSEGQTQIIVFSRDITDRKQAEEALKQSQERNRALLDAIPDVIFRLTTEGVLLDFKGPKEEWDIWHKSRTSYRLTDARLPAPIIQAILSRIRPAVDDNRPQHYHYALKGADATRHYELQIVKSGNNEAVCIVRNITERKKIEELMIQTEKMLSVGGLAAGMAHEINNPLAGILQNMDVVHRRLTQDLPGNHQAALESGVALPALKSYLEKRKIFKLINTIRGEGHRAAQIVKDMLRFNRLSSTPAFTNTDMAALMDKVVELAATDYGLKKKYDFRNITIIKEYAPHLPLIPCEASKIQQVLFNIIKNGAEAMGQTSSPNPRPHFILRINNDANMIRIEIEDNGPGMPGKVKKRIFEPFYTTKPVGSGTGLGLSVAYFIITETHGGNIEVESRPGKGTKITIYLPQQRLVKAADESAQ